MPLYGDPELTYDPGTIRAAIDQEFRQTAQRTYRCYFGPDDSEFYVGNNLPSGLAMYTADPGYSGYVVTSVSVANGPLSTWPGDGATQVRIWMVDVAYAPFTSLLSSITGDPINKPPVIRFQPNRVSKPATEDISGIPILNTAGDPFDPPPEKDSTAVAMIVTRNEASPNLWGILGGWVDHVNEDQWGPFPPRTVKIGPIEMPAWEYSQKSNRIYWPMEYTFDINPDTWDLQLVSQGMREVNPDDSSGRLRTILESDGQPITDPMLLDAGGHRLDPPVNKDDIQIVRVEIYQKFSFSTLGLDSIFANGSTTGNVPPPGSNFGGGDGGFSGGGF